MCGSTAAGCCVLTRIFSSVSGLRRTILSTVPPGPPSIVFVDDIVPVRAPTQVFFYIYRYDFEAELLVAKHKHRLRMKLRMRLKLSERERERD